MSVGPGPERGSARWRIARLGVVDSTNDEARRRALAGDHGRLWIIAEEQSAGRGRRGRSWTSPRGNLYASALLIDPCRPAISPQLGFVAGVALSRAAEDAGAQSLLKWPNDLVCEAGKCAGLLVEGVMLGGGAFGCIVGIGVNCASAPEGVGYPAAILADRVGVPVSRDSLLARLIVRFDEALAEWRDGFAGIREAWLAGSARVGGRIRLETAAGGRRDGVFEGLDPDGRLLFRGERGLETIEAGDIFMLEPHRGASASAPSAAIAREGRV